MDPLKADRWAHIRHRRNAGSSKKLKHSAGWSSWYPPRRIKTQNWIKKIKDIVRGGAVGSSLGS